ncbi:MAG: hypothetical protein ACYC0V_15910 [Armatimonadota bacterium]
MRGQAIAYRPAIGFKSMWQINVGNGRRAVPGNLGRRSAECRGGHSLPADRET